jgi:urease accessory protein
MRPNDRWLTLQLADSAFPTGGFAHSAGLEAAVHAGEVRTSDDVEYHLRSYLWNVGHAMLPFAAAAHDDAYGLAAIDAMADALLTNHVANRASRTQGRALVATCARIFDQPVIAGLAERASSFEAPSHLAPLFGAVFAALEVERRETLSLYLYTSARGVVSAAVRLGVIGPCDAQRLQRRMVSTMDAVLSSCERLALHDAATVAPLLDIVGATHDRLYARLFQS